MAAIDDQVPAYLAGSGLVKEGITGGTSFGRVCTRLCGAPFDATEGVKAQPAASPYALICGQLVIGFAT
jgi:hypothetical protein